MISDSLLSQRIANRKLLPSKYIVFDRDDLYRIITNHPDFSIADSLEIAVVLWFIYAGYTPSQLNLAMEEYVIGYRTHRTAIGIKRSILDRKELPEEVSFVIGRGSQ